MSKQRPKYRDSMRVIVNKYAIINNDKPVRCGKSSRVAYPTERAAIYAARDIYALSRRPQKPRLCTLGNHYHLVRCSSGQLFYSLNLHERHAATAEALLNYEGETSRAILNEALNFGRSAHAVRNKEGQRRVRVSLVALERLGLVSRTYDSVMLLNRQGLGDLVEYFGKQRTPSTERLHDEIHQGRPAD